MACRRHARGPYATPIRLSTASGTFDGRSEDISNGGMLVIARRAPANEEPARLRFALPIEGRIVVVREGFGGLAVPIAPIPMRSALSDSNSNRPPTMSSRRSIATSN